MDAPTVTWYGTGAESASDYPMVAGHWLSSLAPPPAGQMLYLDAFGLRVGGEFGAAAVPKRVPEYMGSNSDIPELFLPEGSNSPMPKVQPMGLPLIIVLLCATACAGSLASMWNAYHICANNPPPTGCQGAPHWICWTDCLLENGCGGPVSVILCLGCAFCLLCIALRLPPAICRRLGDELRKRLKPKKRSIVRETWRCSQYA